MRSVSLALLCLLLLSGTALAGEAGTAAGPSVPAASLVLLRVKQVVLVNDAPAVLLVDAPEHRYLLIFIDFFMASAIRMGLDGPQLDRPLTHDLIGILLRRLGAKVTRVTITGLKDNTYYALLSVQVNARGEVADFDTRPSDALAIAVRNDTPILAEARLLKPIAAPSPPGTPPGAEPGAPPGAPPADENPAPKAKT